MGRIHVNDEDLSGLASRLGGQSEEHDGAVLARRLESLETMVRDLKSEEEQQEVTIRQLREVPYLFMVNITRVIIFLTGNGE